MGLLWCELRPHSLIDDVTLDDDEHKGYPILFTNQEIRMMLRLASVGPSDVFYDLGCGWGQNLVIALTEFHVRKAVGVEKDRERYHVATERLRRWQIQPKRGVVLRDDLDKVLSGRAKGVDLGEATVVFFGLSTDKTLLKRLEQRLRKGSRLVYYFNCLFPEIMPDRADFPFYVSVVPFGHPRSQQSWLSSVLQKKRSSISRGKHPSLEELWDELSHDYDVQKITDKVWDYRRRLRKAVGQRRSRDRPRGLASVRSQSDS